MKSKQNQYILANQIIELIQTLRLRAGHHLTEQFLAAELKVSRTPVRAVLNLLAREGIVTARANQGFFLAKPWAELDQVTIAVPSTAEQDVYAAIVNDRLAGTISETIIQKELEERYKVNRNILLRILARMADEGLVDRNRGRGWTFLPALDSNRALRDSYTFRSAIEPAIFTMPTFVADPILVRRLQADHEFALLSKNVQTLPPLHLAELDSDFHEMIARFSNNSFVINAVQQHTRLRRLLEFQTYTNFRRVRDWLREHLAVLDAIEKGNAVLAAQAMRLHLENAGADASIPPKRGAKLRSTGNKARRSSAATKLLRT